ncbi:MAG: insulinase family protein [Clostridia bacterium]|nr:insulinase family protein [Clostridia bacterium]
MRPVVQKIGTAKLFCIPTDRFKSEYFSLRFTVPLRTETAQKNALTTAVLGRGTKHFPTKLALNRHLDELYSTAISTRNQRLGDMQCIGLAADFLGARYVGGGDGLLPQIVSIMAELLYAPAMQDGLFCDEYLESEKNNLRDAIRAAINNPRSYALSKCRKLLCGGEPYALSLFGEEETIDGITATTLTERYHALLGEIVPTFFYVGNTDPFKVAALIKASFPAFETLPSPYAATVKRGEGAPALATEEMPLCQGKLSIGFRSDVSLGHRLAPAMLLLNEIFGGSPASKLFLNVRERRSLCYHCSSSVDLYKGVLFANAGMTPENRTLTEEAILQEFAAIAKGNISQTEFEAAHRSLEYSYRQVFDNPAALSDFYAGRDLIGSSDTVENFRDAVSRVMREDVVEASEHIRQGATFFLKGTLDGEEDEE